MFVRSRVAKGRTYYALVESYRDGARVRHRQIAALGTNPTVEDAIAANRRGIRRLKTRLARIGASWPASSARPPRTVDEIALVQERLALQEQRLAHLVEVRTRLP